MSTTATTTVRHEDEAASKISETVISLQTQDSSKSQSSTTDASQQHKWKLWWNRFLHYLKQYWFLVGLGTVIGLAWAFPQVGKSNGAIEAQYTVKWGAVIVIFLLSGLGLEVKVMFQTILRWRLHLLVQTINFIFMPFFAYGIVRFFLAVGADLDMSVYQVQEV